MTETEMSPDALPDGATEVAPTGVLADASGGHTSYDPDVAHPVAYDGASAADKTILLWNPASQSADQDLLPEKGSIDARVKDTLRNDAYVRGGSTKQKDSIVGELYALNAKPMTKVLGVGFDDTWEEEFQEEVESIFTLTAESPDNWLDASRQNTLTDMVRLSVGCHTAAGEVLASVEWLRDLGRPCKTAIQFIDTDRLVNPYQKSMTRRIKGGIEKDRRGAPVAYWVKPAFDQLIWPQPISLDPKRVAARKPWGRLQMIHIFEQMRVDQSRGVSEIVSALKEIRVTKKFRDTVLHNAVLNATIAATIESEDRDVAAKALGVETNDDMNLDYMEQVAAYTAKQGGFKIDGARIPHLFPGMKLNMLKAGQGGPLGTDFEQSLLRYIAASLGISYEQLAHDFTDTNYSSARAAMAETWKRMNTIKRMIADRFATIVYRLWLEEAINGGQITSMPNIARTPGWLYQPLRLDAISKCDWIGASRGQIDELKETQAAVLRLKYGLTTYEDELARLGKDWRAVNRQAEREKAAGMDPNAVGGDDNMMNATTGEPREKEENPDG